MQRSTLFAALSVVLSACSIAGTAVPSVTPTVAPTADPRYYTQLFDLNEDPYTRNPTYPEPRIVDIDWSPDDKQIAIAGENSAYLYDVWTATGKSIRSGGGNMLLRNNIEWNTKGDMLLGNGEIDLWVWYPLTEKQSDLAYTIRYEAFMGTTWGPNNHEIATLVWATVNEKSNYIQLYDVAGKRTRRLPTLQGLNPITITWNIPLDLIAVTFEQSSQIELLRPSSGGGQIISQQHGSDIISQPHGSVTAAAWNATGWMLATTTASGTIIIWDVATHKPLHTYHNLIGSVNTISWHPSSSYVAIATDKGVQILDLDTGNALRLQESAASAVAWNHAGTVLAYAQGTTLLTLAFPPQNQQEWKNYQ